jgi:methyl-accepting chemotaxis protein
MKSIRWTLVLSFLLAFAISTAGFFLVSNIYSREAIEVTVMDEIGNIAHAVSHGVEDMNGQQFSTLRTLSTLKFMQDPDKSLWDKQVQLDGIKFSGDFPDLIGINIADTKGDCYVVEGGRVNFAEREYCKAGLAGKEYIQNPMINKVTGTLTMFYAMPVFERDHKVINVVFSAAKGDIVSKACTAYKIGETGKAVVVDRVSGITIGDANLDNVLRFRNVYEDYASAQGSGEMRPVLDRIKKGETGATITALNGVEYVIGFCPIEGTTWSVLVDAPFSEFSGSIVRMNRILVLLTVALALMIIMIGILFGRRLRPLKAVADSMDLLAAGNADLTVRMKPSRRENEITVVTRAMNRLTDKLFAIIKSTKTSTKELASIDKAISECSREILRDIDSIEMSLGNVNHQIDTQTGNVSNTVESVTAITANIDTLESLVQNQSKGVLDATAAVEQLMGNIGVVNESVAKMAGSFEALGAAVDSGTGKQRDVNEKITNILSQSQTLSDANGAIDEIAGQTNLLAMNAAIEAAHAGESGRGFSVVADEIRKLSETSSEQSKRISVELKKIMKSISEVVAASDSASGSFEEVAMSLEKTNEMVVQIKGAMEEQQQGSSSITKVLRDMNDATQEVRSVSGKMAQGNKVILTNIRNLEESNAVIRGSMGEMKRNIERIHGTGKQLDKITDDITEKVSGSIAQIDKEIENYSV